MDYQARDSAVSDQSSEERPLREKGVILAFSLKMQPIPQETQWWNRMPLLTSQRIGKQTERMLVSSCRLFSFPPFVY